jgi:hypothetical protein
MKTELFEKMIRKIIREELEYYNSKLINEIAQIKKVQQPQNKKETSVPPQGNNSLYEGLSRFRNELQSEYNEFSETQEMSFGNAEIPDELKKVFNRDYSELMKKLK